MPLSGPVKPLRLGLLSAAGGRSSLTVQAFADHCRKILSDEMRAVLNVRANQRLGDA